MLAGRAPQLVWFEIVVPTGMTLSLPGIYEWHIDSLGLYVGKSRRLSRRIAEYPNNVRKLSNGLPYRRNKPDGFRPVHRQLCEAHRSGARITVAILENCPLDELSQRERHWIAQRMREQREGGLLVLNGSER